MDESGTILGEKLRGAVLFGNRDLAKKLIAAGAPVEAKNDFGAFPLHTAVY